MTPKNPGAWSGMDTSLEVCERDEWTTHNTLHTASLEHAYKPVLPCHSVSPARTNQPHNIVMHVIAPHFHKPGKRVYGDALFTNEELEFWQRTERHPGNWLVNGGKWDLNSDHLRPTGCPLRATQNTGGCLLPGVVLSIGNTTFLNYFPVTENPTEQLPPICDKA